MAAISNTTPILAPTAVRPVPPKAPAFKPYVAPGHTSPSLVGRAATPPGGPSIAATYSTSSLSTLSASSSTDSVSGLEERASPSSDSDDDFPTLRLRTLVSPIAPPRPFRPMNPRKLEGSHTPFGDGSIFPGNLRVILLRAHAWDVKCTEYFQAFQYRTAMIKEQIKGGFISDLEQSRHFEPRNEVVFDFTLTLDVPRNAPTVQITQLIYKIFPLLLQEVDLCIKFGIDTAPSHEILDLLRR